MLGTCIEIRYPNQIQVVCLFETYFRTWYDRTQRPHCAGCSSHGQNKGFPLSKPTHFPNIANKIWKKLDRYGKPGINVTLKNISTQAFFGFFQIAHLRGFGMPVRQCWFLSLILFGSGFSELLFQTVWLREFRLIFGCSTPASAAVLGVFMAGLGAGGLFFGRKADRSHDPLKLYSRLEIGAACLVVFSPFLVTSQKRGARAPLRLAK